MILEGFDIENWACIKKLTVAGLPRDGRYCAARSESNRKEQPCSSLASLPDGLSIHEHRFEELLSKRHWQRSPRSR